MYATILAIGIWLFAFQLFPSIRYWSSLQVYGAMIAGAVKLPTIIFDEIDTGVSGSIAEKMALIMQEMGKADRQVISITHLPQIASKGQTHYKVYKEDTEVGTNSHIRQLNQEERIHEIANMLSGATLTEAALNNAKALLNNESI